MNATPTQSKMTSIVGGVTRGVVDLFNKGLLHGSILDYGSGRCDRNGAYLRNKGLFVYSYDPFWGVAENGYEGVSDRLPNDSFDVGFSSYVINVVNEQEEDDIIREMNDRCQIQYHIVRNKDVEKMIQMKFYKDKVNNKEKIEIKDLARHGIETTRGFQRVPYLENKGFELIHKEYGFKIYKK